MLSGLPSLSKYAAAAALLVGMIGILVMSRVSVVEAQSLATQKPAAGQAASGEGASGQAAAQSSQTAPWRVECTGNGKILECRAIEQLAQRDQRQGLIPLITLLVHYAADTRTATMQMQLPLGLDLAEPVLVRVDNGEVERRQIQTCNAAGCYLSMPLSDRMIATMKTGTSLKITVTDNNKKAVEVPLPLLGFGLAYDKAK